jgi:DNA (cytosine-5)-methyltransferase 1
VKPRLLDLFCCAGGAGMGYHRAGFEVVGVDVESQPNYPFEFHQADAMEFPLDGFDAIHASPPCQMYSKALKHLAAPQPMLIDGVEARLRKAGVPWVIENVEGAPIPKSSDLFGAHGFMLCGTSFGLRVWRHRLFLSSVPMTAPECRHSGHALNPHNVAGRKRIYAEFGRVNPEKVWQRAVGVEWMTQDEARECVPPAYTEYVGLKLMAHLQQQREVA